MGKGMKSQSEPAQSESAPAVPLPVPAPFRGRSLKPAIRLLVALVLLLTVTARPALLLAAPDFCAPRETPQFRFGFAFLSSRLGETMGDPIECKHGNPANGDTLQATSTGLAYYRSYTNTPTFTDGWNHWAWTFQGLVYWTGSDIDLPGTAVAAEP